MRKAIFTILLAFMAVVGFMSPGSVNAVCIQLDDGSGIAGTIYEIHHIGPLPNAVQDILDLNNLGNLITPVPVNGFVWAHYSGPSTANDPLNVNLRRPQQPIPVSGAFQRIERGTGVPNAALVSAAIPAVFPSVNMWGFTTAGPDTMTYGLMEHQNLAAGQTTAGHPVASIWINFPQLLLGNLTGNWNYVGFGNNALPTLNRVGTARILINRSGLPAVLTNLPATHCVNAFSLNLNMNTFLP